MRLRTRLRQWLADDADTVDDADKTTDADGESEPSAHDPPANDAKTTIEDAEATSLRAIKLPDRERDALDADEREP